MERLETAFFDIPVVTRTWAALVCVVSLLCHLKIISPYHLYFDWEFVIHAKQYWRLISSFFYFGSFGLDFLFHMFFLIRYCQLLEEGSFRNKPADFFLLLLYSAVSITLIAIALPSQQMAFLSAPLTYVIVYIWARRNPYVRMNFLGVFNFQAPYLPWVLVGFSMMLHGLPVSDLVGILVGHVYWYFEDIYPRMVDSRGRRRRRIFKPSRFIMDLFGQAQPLDEQVGNENNRGGEVPPAPQPPAPRQEQVVQQPTETVTEAAASEEETKADEKAALATAKENRQQNQQMPATGAAGSAGASGTTALEAQAESEPGTHARKNNYKHPACSVALVVIVVGPDSQCSSWLMVLL